MTATYVGSLTLGAAVPGARVAAEAGQAGLNTAIPDIGARLAALQAEVLALATMPPLPSFADMLARAQALLDSITLSMTTPGLPAPPSLATAIAALEALIAQLSAITLGLNAQLNIIVNFQTLLAAAGIHVIAYDGDLSTLGTQLQGAVNAHTPGSGHANAVALVTTDTLSWAAMTSVFQVLP